MSQLVAYREQDKPPLSESMVQGDIDIMYYKLYAVFYICQKHSIPCSLFAGSLLGAARHKGVIPWDDDADVVVNQRDYDRLESILQKELPPSLYLHNHYYGKTDIHFMKVRHAQDYSRFGNPKSADLDIFPLVSAPDGMVITEIPDLHKMRFPADWHVNMTTMPVGPYQFPCLASWHEYLTRSYGADYMTKAVKYNHSNKHYGKETIQVPANAPGLLPSYVIQLDHNESVGKEIAKETKTQSFWDHVYLGKQITSEPSTFALWSAGQIGKHLTPRSVLLDIGCGNGRDSQFWSRFCRTIGFDQSVSSCKVSESLSFVQQSADLIGQEYARANAIYMRFFVHAIDLACWQKILASMSQYVQRDALLLIEVRTWLDPMIMAGKRLSKTEAMTDHYRRYQDMWELKQQLALIGFDVQTEEYGFNLSTYRGDNPHLVRLILKKKDAAKRSVAEIQGECDRIERESVRRRTDKEEPFVPVHPIMTPEAKSSRHLWLVPALAILVFAIMKKMRA